jgi:uncharacterized protein
MMSDKYSALKNILGEMEKVLVAYSGGVDSTLLLQVANTVLGDQAVGLIVKSPTFPGRELTEAREIGSALGLTIIERESLEMDLPAFRENTERRCYICKDHRYKMINEFASENGYRFVIDGSNADDLDDFRPGQQAAREQSVRSPLQEIGMSKVEIRELARDLGLPNWDKPSSACLASRIPYDTAITENILNQIEQAEDYLFNSGFQVFRVRHHGNVARIEIPPEDFETLLSQRSEINQAFKTFGFQYVTLDIKGFRSGSFNEGLANYGQKQN